MPLPVDKANRLKRNAALGSITLSVILALLKTVGVFYTGSLAVLSSLIDSLADLFASSITFLAVRYSSQPADCSHRYGHGKAEALSALLQSAFIAGSGLFVMVDGINRLFTPQPIVQAGVGMAIMLISLVLTLVLITYQRYVARQTRSQAIAADSAHYTVDIITNLSIILTLAVIKLWDLSWFDIVTASVISAYLIINAYKLAYNAVSMLLDKELSEDIRSDIRKIVMSCAHIKGMHDLRTHDLGSNYMFELHLELDGNLSLNTAHKYCDEVEAQLRLKYPQAQIIIHEDPVGLTEDRLDDHLGHCNL